MERRKFLAGIGGATSVVLAGCGGDGGTPTRTPGEVGETIAVTSSPPGFDPQEVSIEVGQAVEWQNESGSYREVLADKTEQTKEWSYTGEMAAASGATSTMPKTTKHTFHEEGVYLFIDSLMGRFNRCGLVVVGDASAEDVELPCTGLM